MFVGAAGDQSVRILDGATGRLLRVVHLPLPPSTLLIDARHSRIVAGSPAPVGLLDTRNRVVVMVVSRTAGAPLVVDPQKALVVTPRMGHGPPVLLWRNDRTGRLERTIAWPPSADAFLLPHPSAALDERRGLVYIATRAGPVEVLDEGCGRLDSDRRATLIILQFLAAIVLLGCGREHLEYGAGNFHIGLTAAVAWIARHDGIRINITSGARVCSRVGSINAASGTAQSGAQQSTKITVDSSVVGRATAHGIDVAINILCSSRTK